MRATRTPGPRVPCPLCGAVLAACSIRARAGKRNCLERRFPELRRRRMEAAQRAKREYDRLYSQKKREAIAILAVQVVGQGVATPSLPFRPRDLPAAPPSPLSPRTRDSTPASSPTSSSSESGSVWHGPLIPSPTLVPPSPVQRQPGIIDVTGDEEETDAPEEPSPCPICMEAPTAPVTPFCCRHTMCAECISLHVGHAWAEEELPRCPFCRVILRV
ncbi:hypothetical protein PR002_g18622 [Phytophthora rubi]|uniref:RING-type domain-containing protein n=1 Tax=Phytophthora rubi TaxID=129364 RepID=A0A6A3JU49_9STRA|nr:hypothetical protein PR002_g18622 [Phytophthora rubi]